MPRGKVDHRYQAVRQASKPPTHGLELALYTQLTQDVTTDDYVAYAKEIYDNTYEREIMLAWIVSGAEDTLIHEMMKIPILVTQAYRHLFCDVGVFRDRLDLLNWARKYGDGDQREETQEGAALLQSGIMRGPKALAWIYGGGALEVDPNEVLRNVMNDAYFRGQNSRQYGLTSRELQVSSGLLASAAKIATVLAKQKPSDTNALALKLKYRELTSPLDDAEPDDVLH